MELNCCVEGSYQLKEVIIWWKLSADKSYLLIKVREVRIDKEVKRSDDWWRFACGDIFELMSVNPKSVRLSWPTAEWHVVLSFLTETTSNPFFSVVGGEIACRPVTYKAGEDKQCLPTLCPSTVNYQALRFLYETHRPMWQKVRKFWF